MKTYNISYIVKNGRVYAGNIEAASFEAAVEELRGYWFSKGLEVKDARCEGVFNGQMRIG